MDRSARPLGRDWPAFGAALALGLLESAALLRARLAARWRRAAVFTRR